MGASEAAVEESGAELGPPICPCLCYAGAILEMEQFWKQRCFKAAQEHCRCQRRLGSLRALAEGVQKIMHQAMQWQGRAEWAGEGGDGVEDWA